MFGLFKKNSTVRDLGWIGTDIHSHMLPGIDDGSPDAKTSVEYIRSLKELGFDRLICTPHIFKEIYPNSPDTIGGYSGDADPIPGILTPLFGFGSEILRA